MTGTLLSVGLGLIVIGIGLGIGLVGKSALDAMARQPEMSSKIQSAMLIAAGMVEGAGLFAIVISFIA
ncbi:MAG: ATP synthase F0 subunit C [Bacteroidales bacterium]|nr:ATP synthase F0 subunit C [Bacteroidales bacterium]